MPMRRPTARQTQSLSPFTTTDRRKTLPPLPQAVLDNLLYVYVNALTTDPPLIQSIGDFLNSCPSLYPDQATKLRLQKKISDWDRSPKERTSPSDQDAPEAAKFVKELRYRYWSQHRGHHMSDDDNSEYDIESLPASPEVAATKKASTSKKQQPAPQRFQPRPSSFTMPSDPPTTTLPAYGFSNADIGIDFDTIRKCNSYFAIDPRDPSTLPDGILAWEDKGVKVEVQGTEILKDRVAVLVQLTSPEAANEVTLAKLEKNGQGLVLITCAQDPHFVKSFDDIKDEVADKAGETVDDPDGTTFADRVSETLLYRCSI